MAQNRSHAVMQQRSEPNDSLDDFPTPPWGTRALIEYVLFPHLALGGDSVWEPACNRGFMTRPLAEYFGIVLASDIHDYGHDHWIADFLFPSSFPNDRFGAPAWIITNPPFRLAEQFVHRALTIATVGCAMLVRTAFLEGVGRYNGLFRIRPPTLVAQFVERLPMAKGRCLKDAVTATSYCWLVWSQCERQAQTELVWIKPCRRQLERPTDYPVCWRKGGNPLSPAIPTYPLAVTE
jgi:hypothetical protein